MKKIVYKNCRVNGTVTDIEVTDGRFTKIGKTDEDGVEHTWTIYGS